MPHLMIVDARFYEDISDELVKGATRVLDAAGATYDRVSVPGVFEIPAAVAMAVEAMDEDGTEYDGFVVLGCVIRGETTHYEVVAGESARAIMNLTVDEVVALGNGILTVENPEQAWVRARVGEGDKGGQAAKAALAMIALRRQFEL